ncbi:MAG: ABC transporter ATP-binding protein [Acidobacteria bacterium]|nr:ABC transporter ATP-binding protein [Acidobacteriota bacterium]
MSDVVIKVENLGKKYTIRHQNGAGDGLRHKLHDVATAPFRWLRNQKSGFSNLTSDPRPLASEEFWALKDVSFEVKQGEVVGIIGRNGAGKSTLLKILSRITEPTEGRVGIKGRVASLLEVGTGFHPELTGRENIFLNGAVLGMSREEIKRKFDEIIAFAEVEKFLDTPVKRYSSGMYVRLAFAVAAHLEPEILIVDEVLAVGDAAFQKKSLGKMGEVAREGRTVLFVSHNMNAVESLCTPALLLDRGQLLAQSTDVRAVITHYLNGTSGNGSKLSSWTNENNAFNHPTLQPLYFAVVNEMHQPLTAPVRNDTPLFVVIRADVRQLDPALNVGFALFNQDAELLLWSLTTDGPEDQWPKLKLGVVECCCALPRRFLNEGSYRLELIASLHCRDWFIRPGHNSPVIHFAIQGGLSDSPYWHFVRPGILAPEWKWQTTA